MDLPSLRRIIAPALLLSASLLGVQAAQARPQPATKTIGVTAHSISLGGVIDQTGRGTIVSKPILGGYELAIKQINAAGGVDGRAIQYSALSDNYDPSQTLPQLKQLVESAQVFAILGVFGSDDSNVAVPYTESKRVPLFDPIGGGANLRGTHWTWQTEPSYVREGEAMARYVTTKLHATRVAYLYQVGVGEKQRDALKKTLPKFHATLVAEASYEATDTNLQGQVLHLESANPDIVILNGTPQPTAAFMTYARLAAFRPKYGFLANYPMGDPLWIALVGASNLEGNHVSSYADLTGNNAVADQYRAAINKYGGDKYSNYGLYGYFNAMLFFKALKLTGKKLTRSRLRTVLDTKFRNYKTGFTGEINWTPKQHYGARQFKFYAVRSGQFVPVTGWTNP